MINRDARKLSFGKKAMLTAAGIAAVVGPIVAGQTQTPPPEKRAEFEVASIRRANDDGNHDIDSDEGMYRTHNLSLKRLIATAYEIDLRQIYGGPNWVDSESYDITAKFPKGAALTHEKVLQMLQSLLADQFQLVIHREPRQISGYELVVAKKGLKMERAKPDQKDSNVHSNSTHLKAENVTMEKLARSLSRNRDVGELVVDKTGLTAGFNFELDWSPEQPNSKPDASPDDRPSIFTALQEQLGLKLESAKIPIPAIVIDRAVKPEAD
jgi:bla regulator protein blaR1